MATVIRHAKRGTIVPITHMPGTRGFTGTMAPLERFISFCQFDPTTGCVLWTGGTTTGRGNSAPYGAFWFEGRRWSAHRWSAKHIHGLEIDDLDVDHCCEPYRAGGPEPLPANTLCVQHVQALTGAENGRLRHARQNWILTQKGFLEAPPLFAELCAPPEYDAVPFYEPPAWLKSGVDIPVNSADDCPF